MVHVKDRKHDAGMLRELGLLAAFTCSARLNGYPLCIHGDPTYLISVHLQRPLPNPDGADQRDLNKAMSKVRIDVEWLFGDIKNFFKFVDLRNNRK